MVYQEKLEKEGIYLNVHEEDIFDIKVMIVGPKDTPYQYGYYFFCLQFPHNYPENPPVAKFITTDGRIRFNPNLYQCGKVCLSLLNTFSGPSWTLCQNLKAILFALQTVLNDNPLTNEPGYEHTRRHPNDIYVNYNKVVRYQNYNFAILQMLSNVPNGFEMFQPLMREHFLTNFSAILEDVHKFTQYDHQQVNTFYGMNYKINFTNLLPRLISLQSLLQPSPPVELLIPAVATTQPEPVTITVEKEVVPPPEIITSEMEVTPTETIKQVKKHKRPPSKASSHPIGYTEMFENETYIVYADKTSNLRWKRQV